MLTRFRASALCSLRSTKDCAALQSAFTSPGLVVIPCQPPAAGLLQRTATWILSAPALHMEQMLITWRRLARHHFSLPAAAGMLRWLPCSWR